MLCTSVVCCHTFGWGYTNNLLGILHCSLNNFLGRNIWAPWVCNQKWHRLQSLRIMTHLRHYHSLDITDILAFCGNFTRSPQNQSAHWCSTRRRPVPTRCRLPTARQWAFLRPAAPVCRSLASSAACRTAYFSAHTFRSLWRTMKRRAFNFSLFVTTSCLKNTLGKETRTGPRMKKSSDWCIVTMNWTYRCLGLWSSNRRGRRRSPRWGPVASGPGAVGDPPRTSCTCTGTPRSRLGLPGERTAPVRPPLPTFRLLQENLHFDALLHWCEKI